MSDPIVLSFDHIGENDLARVGGKGQHLGDMARAGLPVPPGFCVTTTAFRRFVADSGAAEEIYAALAALRPGEVDEARRVGAWVRSRLTQAPVPAPVRAAIVEAFHRAGASHAYAVRSSATAEDLP